MKDAVKLGNGKSRVMKAGIAQDTTWEQFKAMLLAGNMPFDMGLNEAGWQVMATPLSKNTLLNDTTASSLGFDHTTDPTVNDGLYRLMAMIGAKTFTNNLEDVEIESNKVSGSGWVDYTFKKPFTDVPSVIAFNGTTLVATNNVTALTMQITAPAIFIAIYDGGVL